MRGFKPGCQHNHLNFRAGRITSPSTTRPQKPAKYPYNYQGLRISGTSLIGTRISWTFPKPLPKSTKLPELFWQLTDLGKKEVDVVISAVASELTSKATPGTQTR
jgi:hypothetical protein